MEKYFHQQKNSINSVSIKYPNLVTLIRKDSIDIIIDAQSINAVPIIYNLIHWQTCFEACSSHKYQTESQYHNQCSSPDIRTRGHLLTSHYHFHLFPGIRWYLSELPYLTDPDNHLKINLNSIAQFTLNISLVTIFSVF